jgi:hypothetical protein
MRIAVVCRPGPGDRPVGVADAVRPCTGNISIGAQLGFLATGVVVDVDLGPVCRECGVNYPLG